MRTLSQQHLLCSSTSHSRSMCSQSHAASQQHSVQQRSAAEFTMRHQQEDIVTTTNPPPGHDIMHHDHVLAGGDKRDPVCLQIPPQRLACCSLQHTRLEGQQMHNIVCGQMIFTQHHSKLNHNCQPLIVLLQHTEVLFAADYTPESWSTHRQTS